MYSLDETTSFFNNRYRDIATDIEIVEKTGHRICMYVRGLLEKYPTFGREKETGLLGALDT